MNIFDTDFHCHILPGIDDGAANVDESIKLINMQLSQGVRNIVATPHFRKHQMSINTFLERRNQAYKTLISAGAFKKVSRVLLAAEIALERNLCELDGIERLGNSKMNTLLLELPYDGYRKWMCEEIEEIAYTTKMQIIIAHLDRYTDIYTQEDYNDIFSIPDVIFQFNTSAFTRIKDKKLLKTAIKDDYPLVFGTDCHNPQSRRPDFDVMLKNLKHYEQNYFVNKLFEPQ